MVQRYTFSLMFSVDAADDDLCFEVNADVRRFAASVVNMGAMSTVLTVSADDEILETHVLQVEAA